MQMLCPECLTPLTSDDGQVATCPADGAEFRILHTRYSINPPAIAETATTQAESGYPQELAAPVDAQDIVADVPLRPETEATPQVGEDDAALTLPQIEPEPDGKVVESLPAEIDSIPMGSGSSIAELLLEPVLEQSMEVMEPPPIEPAPPAAEDGIAADITPAAQPIEDILDRNEPSIEDNFIALTLDAVEEPPAELDISEPEVPAAPAAPLPSIPTPPPRPARVKKSAPAPPPAEETSQPVLPRDPFEMSSVDIMPLPDAVFAPGVEVPSLPQQPPTARANKPLSRPARVPAPPPPEVKAPEQSRRPPAQPPTPQPKSPGTRKPQPLGRCAIHNNAIAVAVCRSCGAPVCEACDQVGSGQIHQCPHCAGLTRNSQARFRGRTAKWSIGLACWSFLGLLLVLTGATRAFAQTAGEFDSAALILMTIWLFSPFVGLALAIFSFKRGQPNSRIVWIAIISNAGLILAWVMPFWSILTRHQE